MCLWCDVVLAAAWIYGKSIWPGFSAKSDHLARAISCLLSLLCHCAELSIVADDGSALHFLLPLLQPSFLLHRLLRSVLSAPSLLSIDLAVSEDGSSLSLNQHIRNHHNGQYCLLVYCLCSV